MKIALRTATMRFSCMGTHKKNVNWTFSRLWSGVGACFHREVHTASSAVLWSTLANNDKIVIHAHVDSDNLLFYYFWLCTRNAEKRARTQVRGRYQTRVRACYQLQRAQYTSASNCS
jgi:hypothetical protein